MKSLESQRKFYVDKRKKYSTAPDVVRRREQRLQRRHTALQLRMAGASYADIVAANIGYKSIQHVSIDMKKILTDFTVEAPEDVLILDLARLDAMQRKLSQAFFANDLAQAGMILRVMQFRRETLGITPEVIAQRSTESKALVNNGIMVVQGSAEDYLRSMMQAAGASPEQQQVELERVAASNRRTAPTEVIDAEVVEDAPTREKVAQAEKEVAQARNKSRGT